MVDTGPYARLERLLIPHLADTVALWAMGGAGGAARVAGTGQVDPPAAALGEHALWGRSPDGVWTPCDPGSVPADRRILALGLPEAETWLVVERAEGRAAFAASEVEWVREAAALAGQALQSSQLSERVLEARAVADSAAHRWAAVARVTGQLARSVDLEETIETVLGAVVPYHADCAVIDLVGPRGTHRRVTRHVGAECAESSDSPHAFPFGNVPIADAIGALPEEGLCVTRWDDEAMERHVPAHEREHVERLGPRSLAVVPLRLGDAMSGALTIISAESGQEYGATDLDLFRQIGRQVGLALTAAITFADVRTARREREEVLAIVSHDLKNPLNVLRFATSLLLMPGLPDDRKQKQIPVIERAVLQMDELIQNLLDASRIDAGRFSVDPSPVSPEALIREAMDQIAPLAEQQGVAVELELEDELPAIAADRERLLRVFGNLGSNAISFSPAGGAVQVRAATRPGLVRFEVVDHGPGIEPEALEHIFDRYWQARQQGHAGAGLGLTIVRGIVDAHGGTIEVDSTLGVGTTFRFTIPVAAPAAARSRDLEPYPGEEEYDGA
jgi:signal transduction histidine kinase